MKPIPPGNLCRKALEIAKGMTLEDLFRKTDLPLSWLRKFREGRIKSPSVQRVERIIVAVTGKEIL